MAIRISEDGRLIRLETKTSVYQMKADAFGTLWHTHYGEKTGEDDLSYALYMRQRGHSCNPYEVGMTDRSYSLELIPQELGCFGGSDFRSPALRVRFADGARTLQLRFESCRVEDGKYTLDALPASYDETGDAQTLTVRLTDAEAKIAVELRYGVFEEADVITRTMRVINESDAPVFLEKAASLCVDFPRGDYELLTFCGRWAKERIPERLPLRQGMNAIGSTRGFSGARFNPSAMLLEQGTTETYGKAYGFAFVYSGDFLLEAERDTIVGTRVLLGINPDTFEWKLAPHEAFQTPEALMTFSDSGISGISLRFHRFISRHIVRGTWRAKPRPVLLNNWEGTYFNFDGEKLVQMARRAAEAGVELFVLDDGWFGARDDDKRALGDWTPNEKKLGCTLAELADRIRAEGLQFGLWFEPEAISEDSDLYRAHPDWAVAIPGRKPSLSRYELLLDLSRRDVQDYLIRELSDRIREAKLTYLKWDLNRSLCDRYTASLPAERQGEMPHRYILGTYRVLDALCKAFPDLLIESCASGGSRFDAGMLCYTPQIWTSDDTDPIERLQIQHGTSMIYPVSTMGAHVSASPNHQTGRVTSMKTRATVAMSGTFGYELDATKLTDAETAQMRGQIKTFHTLYDLLQHGDYYRLLPPDSDSATVWEQAACDGSRALVNIVVHGVRPSPLEKRFFVQGLCDGKNYRISLIDPDDLAKLPPRQQELFGGGILSGRTLRTVGLYVPEGALSREESGDYPSYQILLEQI